MALPIDTTTLTVLCGGAPTAVVDRETGEHRTNRDGETLFRTEVIVLGSGRALVLPVRTTKEPKGLTAGSPVRLTGFSISTFVARDGGTGVLYEAGSIEPVKVGREAS